MIRQRWAHGEWVASYPGLDLVLSRYGHELARFHAREVNSGARTRSNQGRAIAEAERWCDDNGYAGIVWEA